MHLADVAQQPLIQPSSCPAIVKYLGTSMDHRHVKSRLLHFGRFVWQRGRRVVQVLLIVIAIVGALLFLNEIGNIGWDYLSGNSFYSVATHAFGAKLWFAVALAAVIAGLLTRGSATSHSKVVPSSGDGAPPPDGTGENPLDLEHVSRHLLSIANAPVSMLILGFGLTTLIGGLATNILTRHENSTHFVEVSDDALSNQVNDLRALINASLAKLSLDTILMRDDLGRANAQVDLDSHWQKFQSDFEDGYLNSWKNIAATQWSGDIAESDLQFSYYLSDVIEVDLEATRNCMAIARDAYAAPHGSSPPPQQVFDDCEQKALRQMGPDAGWEKLQDCMRTFAFDLALSAKYSRAMTLISRVPRSSAMTRLLGDPTYEQLTSDQDPQRDLARLYKRLPQDLLNNCGLR